MFLTPITFGRKAGIMFVLTLVSLWSGVMCAQEPITIDFQSCARPGPSFSSWAALYHEKGFTFGNVSASPAHPNDSGFRSWNTESGPATYTGSTMLFNPIAGADNSLSRIGQGSFDFVQIDLASMDLDQPIGPLTFRGYRGATLVVSETFQPNGGGRQTFRPQQPFSNLTEVRWAQTGHQFDNVTLIERAQATSSIQIAISSGGSGWQFNVSYLIPGGVYILQRSTDLRSWQNVRYLEFFAPTGQTEDSNSLPSAFYRLSRP